MTSIWKGKLTLEMQTMNLERKFVQTDETKCRLCELERIDLKEGMIEKMQNLKETEA